jgi:hypothetical protein
MADYSEAGSWQTARGLPVGLKIVPLTDEVPVTARKLCRHNVFQPLRRNGIGEGLEARSPRRVKFRVHAKGSWP